MTSSSNATSSDSTNNSNHIKIHKNHPESKKPKISFSIDSIINSQNSQNNGKANTHNQHNSPSSASSAAPGPGSNHHVSPLSIHRPWDIPTGLHHHPAFYHLPFHSHHHPSHNPYEFVPKNLNNNNNHHHHNNHHNNNHHHHHQFRPRSADESDTRSEGSSEGGSGSGDDVSESDGQSPYKGNSSSSNVNNSPLDALFKLTNKALDRVNNDKPGKNEKSFPLFSPNPFHYDPQSDLLISLFFRESIKLSSCHCIPFFPPLP